MPSLPTVRNSGAKLSFFPDSDALSKCMAVANTPEAADYLLTRVKQIFSTAKNLGESVVQNVMDTINDFVNYVKLANQAGNEWVGKPPRSGFQNYQEGLAAIAAQIMQGKNVELDYAISDDSQYLRGYTTDGAPMDADSSKAMDNYFNAWLAMNHLFSKGGVIYESTSDGQIKMEGENPVRANADDFRQLIQDPKRGFGQYMSKTNKSVQLSMYPQEFQTSETPSNVAEATATTRSSSGG